MGQAGVWEGRYFGKLVALLLDIFFPWGSRSACAPSERNLQFIHFVLEINFALATNDEELP